MNLKNLFIFLLLSLLFLQGFSQQTVLVPHVDERTELLSIVFRLSEAKEFVNDEIQIYTSKINRYFRKYKEEKIIFLAKKLRAEQGVSYDAVMSMAVHIEITNGKIQLKKSISEKSLDKRWGDKTNEFIMLLNEFYVHTKFKQFFSDNTDLFKLAESRYSNLISTIDMDWFEKYYGTKPSGTFNMIISFSNGGMSYGPKVINSNGKEDMYAIIATYETDSTGMPICSNDFTETIIHEFNHSFCNNLIEKHFSAMKNNAEIFYNLVIEKMQNQAYGNAKTMLYEILVRASVIKYFQDHNVNNIEINNLISLELSKGFIWIEQLIESLTNYENSRKTYPTLEKYMPQIIELQNNLNPEFIVKNFDAEFPQIQNYSINNNSQDVDPTTQELIVTFNKPMYTNGYGINYAQCGKSCFPDLLDVKWSTEKNNELILLINLEPDKQYSMIFPAVHNLGANGFILKENYLLNFRTRK